MKEIQNWQKKWNSVSIRAIVKNMKKKIHNDNDLRTVKQKHENSKQNAISK